MLWSPHELLESLHLQPNRRVLARIPAPHATVRCKLRGLLKNYEVLAQEQVT
jgi:hypothetical protein